tara:strand:+ start:553 stop:891 length:339 start_codon:yes stop_codon:yes gene_type:complete
MDIYYILIYLSAFSFLYYSINSIFSKRLILEFERWGYKKYRYIIAIFQFLASVGFIVGMYYSLLISIVSFLLFIMMVVAIYTRVKVKDSLFEILPAFFYALLNLVIFIKSII